MSARLPYKFSTEKFYQLYELEILDERTRLELLCGELVAMWPISPRHAQACTNLNSFLLEGARRRFMVSPLNVLELNDFSAPRPDLVIVTPDRNRKRHVRPCDAHLVIEVADDSLTYDLDDKLRAYAIAKIPEYWIVDLINDEFRIYREPQGGTFRDSNVVGLTGTVSLAAFPDLELSVGEVMPRV